MTEILSSILGRKKPKPPVPPPPVSSHSTTSHFSEATSNGFVVVNATNGPQASGSLLESKNQQPPKPNDDYESLFSYLRVSPSNPAMNGSQNGSYAPIRPAPPVPNESSLPYPLHHRTWATRTETTTTMTATAVTTEQSTTAHYLTGIPFQVSKSLGGAALLGGLDRELNIKSPNMGEYDYSFALEMEIVQESCPKSP